MVICSNDAVLSAVTLVVLWELESVIFLAQPQAHPWTILFIIMLIIILSTLFCLPYEYFPGVFRHDR